MIENIIMYADYKDGWQLRSGVAKIDPAGFANVRKVNLVCALKKRIKQRKRSVASL